MALAVRFYDQQPDVAGDSLREDVLNGLAAEPKVIAPKYFYDQRGSELFEAITGTPEYYPTRTEERILTEAANDIAAIAGPGTTLMELGSGASRKVRLLLEALRPQSYLGVDISRDFLLSSTHRLAADYPWLDVSALCTDFTQPMELPRTLSQSPVLAFFPGSSIGNFTPVEARAFLRNLHRLLPPGSGLLIGVDLIKSKARLEAAYNDAEGITAAFNLNVLERICRELDTDLDPSRFSHYAFYNEQQSRIEMHLVSRRAQTIRIEDQRFMFRQGETLHTENSYKYSLKGFETLSREAGFSPIAVWKDPGALFSVHYLGK
ncbi:L-histidine N(alpha)-methyltransferase [Pseudomonas asuensis]|jgi:dimethylhistidine N-methyltransferase|uniref:Dimethylhistidine N-methyltransferase n=1 Tax=Pseudomonas asuensis TaxID=1825787 RepID=A0ABQ2GM47_9PSED|nr:L-histidine N(alpha)-methyltransferase [Pseudomonas asuensis]GGM02058.1 dimethylhistidine N-methyltransferase [Pseudomonas asuensis]